MSTKSEVLQLLLDNRGRFMSGQEMADTIYVTRASVWKAIKALEKEGFDIEAVTNRGYRLKTSEDMIDANFIEEALTRELKVIYYDEVDSTNSEAKRLNEEYGNSDFIVIADHQTSGRGRRGREFYSPSGSGIYMSLVIHPGRDFAKLATITGIAATSVAKSIDEVFFSGEDYTKIKWVNDIFIDDLKVSGILTEGFTLLEDEDSNYVIIGFGVNVYEPENGFPRQLKKIAGPVLSKSIRFDYDKSKVRSVLAASIINNLFYYYENQNESLKIYKAKSNLIGNSVLVKKYGQEDNHNIYAKVTGINNKYHLLIEYEDGEKEELSSGEVSVIKY